MLRTIYLVGAPGCGKSTLVRAILPALGPHDPKVYYRKTADGRQLNPVVMTPYPETRVLVLGLYDESPYGGTDRFGLNVAPVARATLPWLLTTEYNGWTILGEGDRLALPGFFDIARECGVLKLAYLAVTQEVLDTRRALRASAADGDWVKTAGKNIGGRPRRANRDQGQDASWLHGRMTKVQRLIESYSTIVLPNNDLEDQRRAIRQVETLLGLVVGMIA